MKPNILRRAMLAGAIAASTMIGITAATPAHAQFGGIVPVGSDRKNVGARNDRRGTGGHDEGIDVVFAHRRCGLPDGRLFRDRFER